MQRSTWRSERSSSSVTNYQRWQLSQRRGTSGIVHDRSTAPLQRSFARTSRPAWTSRRSSSWSSSSPSSSSSDKQTCLDKSQVCDGVDDCPMTEVSGGGEEEDGCEGSGLSDCAPGEHSPGVAGFQIGKLAPEVSPNEGKQLKPASFLMKRNHMTHCICETSDEWTCDGSCIERSLRCDGTVHCQDQR